MKRINIDLSKCKDCIDGSYDKIIKKILEQKKVYGDNFLYTVFNAHRIKQVEETGNYRKNNPNSIFALDKARLIWDINDPNDLRNLTKMYPEPALAVYDKTKFKAITDVEYEFKNPSKKLEALVGICVLRLE